MALKKKTQDIILTLPQHRLPAPLDGLLKLGLEEDIAYYEKLANLPDGPAATRRIDELTDVALDESYVDYIPDHFVETDAVDPRALAPMHALRALAFFAERAFIAFPRLVALLSSIDPILLEELPFLFTCLGPGVVEPLTAILLDDGADPNAREMAAECLVEAGENELTSMHEVAANIASVLYRSTDDEFSSYLILHLMDTGDKSCLPLIEDKFSKAKIDPEVITLEQVKKHYDEQPDEDYDEDYDDDEYDEDQEAELPIDNEEVQMPFIAPPKVGRNDLCPCGSGKKYKKCCGQG